MGHVTFSAIWPVMILDDNLLEPGRAGHVGFVTTDAVAAGCFDWQDVRVVGMLPAHAVAILAGKRLVRIRRHLVQDVGMTFIARLLASKYGWPRRNLRQRIAAIPSVLAKGRRCQKRSRNQIRPHDGQRQQDQTQNLWWQLEAAHKTRLCFKSSGG